MKDSGDELESFARCLAAFQPAPPPASHEMQFAAGLRAGRNAAARRYRSMIAAIGVICLVAVGLALRQSVQNHRLQNAVATLELDVRAAELALAAKPTDASTTKLLANASATVASERRTEPSFHHARQDSIEPLAATPLSLAIGQPVSGLLRWGRLNTDDVLRIAAPDSRLDSHSYAARPMDSKGTTPFHEPTLTIGAGRSGTLSFSL